MSNPAQNRKVAVSYAWKQEKEGENHGAVVQFCDGLTSRNIQVLRDTEHLKFGQGISDFMARIGSSDFLCIFLSDDYLRSPNCMCELLIGGAEPILRRNRRAGQYSGRNGGELREPCMTRDEKITQR